MSVKFNPLALRLRPTYIRRLKAQLATAKTVHSWTHSAKVSLQVCLEATDWYMFLMATDGIHKHAKVVSDYISRCTSFWALPRTAGGSSKVLTAQKSQQFPNQKPWGYRSIHFFFLKAFKTGDQQDFRKAPSDLQKSIRVAKRANSPKLESFCLSNNTQSIWQGMPGCHTPRPPRSVEWVRVQNTGVNHSCFGG